MKKIIFPVLFLVVFGGTVYYFWKTQGFHRLANANAAAEAPDPVSKYFKDKISSIIANKTGQLANRIDANLVVSVFPGLQEGDFAGVNATDGAYELRNGQLAFVAVSNTTTAINTISGPGYLKLLENLGTRLNLPVSTDKEIDALLEKIQK